MRLEKGWREQADWQLGCIPFSPLLAAGVTSSLSFCLGLSELMECELDLHVKVNSFCKVIKCWPRSTFYILDCPPVAFNSCSLGLVDVYSSAFFYSCFFFFSIHLTTKLIGIILSQFHNSTNCIISMLYMPISFPMNEKSGQLGMRTMSHPSAFKAVWHILQMAMSCFSKYIYFSCHWAPWKANGIFWILFSCSLKNRIRS